MWCKASWASRMRKHLCIGDTGDACTQSLFKAVVMSECWLVSINFLNIYFYMLTYHLMHMYLLYQASVGLWDTKKGQTWVLAEIAFLNVVWLSISEVILNTFSDVNWTTNCSSISMHSSLLSCLFVYLIHLWSDVYLKNDMITPFYFCRYRGPCDVITSDGRTNSEDLVLFCFMCIDTAR